MSAPDRVKELVEKFAENSDKHSLNETQVRQQYIDPLFEVLEWDVGSRKLRRQSVREVVLEDRIRVSNRLRAPDYGFYLGGSRRFFVEAKRPKEDIERSKGHAFQLRSYGWSANLPLSILTDFEEFAIYDCRVRPNPDDSTGVARERYLTFEDYEKDDCWDEISDLFSKESVRKGSLDAFMPEKKKATDPVDRAFLRQIEAWRSRLAEDIHLSNPNLDRYDLNFAVQATIDRIVFLRVCEDRGTEEYLRLEGILDGDGVYKRLLGLFMDADNRYNSGLFHFHNERGRSSHDTLTPGLDISDGVLRDVISGLYPPKSPYQFSVMPVEILGQTYEQFLGSVITIGDGSEGSSGVTVEQKPEVRKAGGVYYTPEYIVDYIVEKTVGELVKGKTHRQVANLKFVDPACGSGSFLIGAYDFLLDWHIRHYVEDDPEKHKDKIYEYLYPTDDEPVGGEREAGEWRLRISEKKRILTSNIHGVDIDAQAVEVTKLSLLLKVLEGEDGETMQLSMERILPDLEKNIKCGNSLIGHDFYDNEQMSFLDEDEQRRINTFDWESAFPEVFRGKSPGFDAVIGNPPYGAYLYKLEKGYLTSKYVCQSYQLDSYLLFLEQAMKTVLHRDGFYGMIVPNPWLTNVLQSKIRKFVAGSTRIHEIVHFRFSVFPKVTVDTEILILQNSSPDGWQSLVTIVESLEHFLNSTKSDENTQIQHDQQKWRDLDGDTFNIFASEAEEQLAEKCFTNGLRLDVLFNVNVGIKPYQTGKGKPPQTKDIVKNRPYDRDRPLDSSFRQYLRGKDIGRYKIIPLEKRYLKYGSWLAEPRPSANFDAPIKIVMRQTGDSLVAAADTAQYLCLNNMHVLVPKEMDMSLFYSLGLINSKLLNWYYHSLNPEVGEALAEVKKANVAKLPIRTIDFSDPNDEARHDRMVSLVERMLGLHGRLSEAKSPWDQDRIQAGIASTDRRIDGLVYELYGLTDEEIELVEGAT